jgi:hypothetical protein
MRRWEPVFARLDNRPFIAYDYAQRVQPPMLPRRPADPAKASKTSDADCPDQRRLARFAEGSVEPEELEARLEHRSACCLLAAEL